MMPRIVQHKMMFHFVKSLQESDLFKLNLQIQMGLPSNLPMQCFPACIGRVLVACELVESTTIELHPHHCCERRWFMAEA